MLRKQFETRIRNLGARMKRIENSMDKIQKTVMYQVRGYGAELKNLRAEIRALETAFTKILEPLVTNIRKFEESSAEKEFSRLKRKKREEEKLESKLTKKRKR
jgi:hypothetical protein